MWTELITYAQEIGIQMPAEAIDRFAAYYHLLIDGNKQVNLTRITGDREVLIKHFLDSLQLLSWQGEPRGSLLDVGSGAGFPGIPLKIARPNMPLVLLDSSNKRVAFLQQVIDTLGFDAGVHHGRAEDFGRDPAWREQFALVASRAVAPLNILAEFCLPFVAPGGYFVAYKGPEGLQEARGAESALEKLNSLLETVIPYSLPEGMGERCLLIVVKRGPLSEKFPRRAGIPEKRPL
jgi:16S rRNA (guanine527-N7)-methyltransferase